MSKKSREIEEHKKTIDEHCEKFPSGAVAMFLSQKATIEGNVTLVFSHHYGCWREMPTIALVWFDDKKHVQRTTVSNFDLVKVLKKRTR